MSNEHLSQEGESAVDQTSNGDGYDIDEGPLDPSVFFGLFDDLGDDSEPEPAGDGEPAGVVVAPDETAAATERESHTPETRPATVSWWTTTLDEQPANGRDVEVASPPPIPPGAGRAGTIESLEGTETADAAQVADDGRPPVVTFAPIDTDRGFNGTGAQDLQSGATTEVPEAAGGTAAVPTGGGAMGKAALATIAVGLFAALVAASVLSLRSPDAEISGSAAGGSDEEDPAASTAVEEPPTGLAGAVATGTRPTADVLAEEFAAALRAALSNRLDLTSLRFEPGTTELDERSTVIINELGTLLAQQPTVPVTVSVRTYTESTPAGNLALSSDQADALITALVSAGAAPDQIRARGLGAAPLSQAQPVPNFVVLTPRFGDRRLDRAIAGGSPFALGIPATATDDVWPLRPDGLLAIGQLAETFSAYPDAEVGAAGYSFLPPSPAGIRTEADTAAANLAEFLVTVYGIEPGKVTTIIPGSALFVPTPEHGNHIWLQTGPASQGAFDVASIDPAAITFEAGSAELDDQGLATVRALADILTASGATIVVDVRSYESADAATDQALSEARRDALAAALTTAGVAPEQLRSHASGASSYLLADGGPSITITVAP